MLKRLQFLQNTDKFYGLADSALLSGYRFACGLAIARIGGAELFASFILLMTTSIIFQILPSTAYLIPLLNKGTGANPAVYGALCSWAQRGVERAALVFLPVGVLCTYILIPGQFSIATSVGFALAASSQLLQSAARTRLQIEFKLSSAFSIDLVSILVHCLVSVTLWLQCGSILTAYWFGSFAAAAFGIVRMRLQATSVSTGAQIEQTPILDRAKADGRSMFKGSIANSVCSRIQPYLLGIFSTPETLAFYGVIWTLIGPIRLLIMAVSNLLRPRLALYVNQSRIDDFARTLRLSYALILITTLLAAPLSLVFGSNLTLVLFGPELAAAGKWLSLGIVYAGLDAFTSCQMIGAQTRLVCGAQLTARLRIQSALIAVPLFILGTLQFGLVGSISSLIIAELYYAIGCATRAPLTPSTEKYTTEQAQLNAPT
ncbi:MAG: hypothetical protein ACPGJU_08020 [Coraliomargarita sp.]